MCAKHIFLVQNCLSCIKVLLDLCVHQYFPCMYVRIFLFIVGINLELQKRYGNANPLLKTGVEVGGRGGELLLSLPALRKSTVQCGVLLISFLLYPR